MEFNNKNNICKELAWKVPFENYQVLSPEFYEEKNLQILYKDYEYDNKGKKVYLIDNECNNPIVLEEHNFNDFSSNCKLHSGKCKSKYVFISSEQNIPPLFNF